MEAEIVSMCLDLFNGPQGAGTSKHNTRPFRHTHADRQPRPAGRSQSSCLSRHIETGPGRRRASQSPNCTCTSGLHGTVCRTIIRVIPSSAHAAFWKACEYFKIKLHVIPVNEETRQADVRRMARAVWVTPVASIYRWLQLMIKKRKHHHGCRLGTELPRWRCSRSAAMATVVLVLNDDRTLFLLWANWPSEKTSVSMSTAAWGHSSCLSSIELALLAKLSLSTSR